MLAVLALPVLIAIEWVGDRLMNSALSMAVERATAKKRFSWARIGYHLLLVLGALAATIAVGQLWRSFQM